MLHVILLFFIALELRMIRLCCTYNNVIVCLHSCMLVLHCYLLLDKWMNWMLVGIMSYVDCLVITNGRVLVHCYYRWKDLMLNISLCFVRLIFISICCTALMFLSIICFARFCIITVTMVFYSNLSFVVNLMPFTVSGQPFRTMFYVSMHFCDFIVVFSFLCVYSLFSVCLVAWVGG